ncbi:PAS domain S-box protein [Parasediminibacterium sp. JCM 36343]|uniref:PAS domain S-box protein n=1 Tax=Parasediminibacterium sp. JCM 36343 TaxID=3374279 RepID=UPI00397E2A04
MNLSFEKKIFLIFICLLAATVLAGVYTYKNSNATQATNFWVKHTEEVLYRSEKTLSAIRDIESASRGFILTGDTSFYKLDKKNYDSIYANISILKSLTKDNQQQQRRIDSIANSTTCRLRLLGEISEYKKLHNTNLAEAAIATQVKNGKRCMDEIATHINGIQQEENKLLILREEANAKSLHQFYYTLYALLGCIGILFILAWWWIGINIKTRKKNGVELLNAKKFLEAINNLTRIGHWEIDMRQEKIFLSTITSEVYELPAFYQLGIAEMLGFYKEGESRDTIEEAFKNAREKGIAFDLQLQIATFKGKGRWVEMKGVAEFAKGKCVRLYGTLQDISTIKKREYLFIENEALLTNLYGNTPMLVGLVEIEGNDILHIKMNKWGAAYMGKAEAEISNRYGSELGSPQETLDLWIGYFKEAERLGKPLKLEYERIKDGKAYYFKGMAAYIGINEAGKKRYAYLSEDISPQKYIELQLLQSEEQFRGTFENSAIGIAIVSLTGQWIDVNPSVCNIVGYTKKELLSLTFQDITHQDDLEDDLGNVNALLEGRSNNYTLEKRYLHKDGSVVWVLLTVSLLRDAANKPVHFISQIIDITSKKKSEEQVMRLVSDLNAVLNATTEVSIISTDLVGNINHFNRGAENLLGYTAAEMVGKQTPEIIHLKEEVEARSQQLSTRFGREIKGFDVFVEYSRQGRFESREWTYRRKNGSTFTVQLVVTPKISDTGEIIGFLGVAVDISRIKNIEKQLKESELKFRTLFALSPVGFVLKDLESGNYVDFNDAFLKDIGFSRNELLSKSYLSITVNGQEEVRLLAGLKDKEHYGPIEMEYIKKDGTHYTALKNGVKIIDSTGNELVWAVIQNITELKEKEKELKQLAGEIEARNKELGNINQELEQFAYVASHDLQEPLRMITGFISLLQKKYSDVLDDNGRKYLSIIVDGAVRMRTIITDILDYSRLNKAEAEHTPVDLNRILKEIAQVHLSGIQTPLPLIELDNMPTIIADKTAMQQLFSNLISNALKYQVPGTQPIVKIKAQDNGASWQFSVADNGIGILPQFYDKVFAVFQRLHSKEEYAGTGIGLAICKKIVQNHHGEIWIEPTMGGGATFLFTISKK